MLLQEISKLIEEAATFSQMQNNSNNNQSKFNWAINMPLAGIGSLLIYKAKDIFHNLFGESPSSLNEKISDLNSQKDNLIQSTQSKETELVELSRKIKIKQNLLDDLNEQAKEENTTISAIFIALSSLVIGAYSILKMAEKEHLVNFDNQLISFQKLLSSSGFKQIDTIYNNAQNIRQKTLATCKQPKTNIFETLLQNFTNQLNCIHIALIQYALTIISQSYILYFTLSKNSNSNIKNLSDILSISFPNCKVFRRELIKMTELFYIIVDVLYKTTPNNIVIKNELEKMVLIQIKR